VAERYLKKQSRRNFLRDAVRYALLTLVCFVAGSAFTKRRKLLQEGSCVNQDICGGCELYKNCQLPQALSRKQVLAENFDADRKN
jgi:hypothetical protein